MPAAQGVLVAECFQGELSALHLSSTHHDSRLLPKEGHSICWGGPMAHLLLSDVICLPLIHASSKEAGFIPSNVMPTTTMCTGADEQMVPAAAATSQDAASFHSIDIHIQSCDSGPPGLQHDRLQLLWRLHDPGCAQFLFHLRCIPADLSGLPEMPSLQHCPHSNSARAARAMAARSAVCITQVLGPEQFMAFFISAGMASSLTSYIGRLRSFKGGYSLGASGAVYACFAAVAILYPGTCAALCIVVLHAATQTGSSIHCCALEK